MPGYPRYAIYFAPPPNSDLDRFGAHLLGYDANTAQDLPFAQGIEQAIPGWNNITSGPRKYGFHATLKAPFVLKPGKTEPELLAACDAFAHMPRSIPVIEPVIAAIDGFIAVVPSRTSAELGPLAADCTCEFDVFRAALTSEDRARRNPSMLTRRQRKYLDRWGYPYVMEDFRFHMTLTGYLDAKRRETIQPILAERFVALKIPRLVIDRIALFCQDGPNSRFRVLKQYVLEREQNSEH